MEIYKTYFYFFQKITKNLLKKQILFIKTIEYAVTLH